MCVLVRLCACAIMDIHNMLRLNSIYHSSKLANEAKKFTTAIALNKNRSLNDVDTYIYFLLGHSKQIVN